MLSANLALWPSGKAAVLHTATPGSIPGGATNRGPWPNGKAPDSESGDVSSTLTGPASTFTIEGFLSVSCSSMVERTAVNGVVAGSSPAGTANRGRRWALNGL